MILLAIGDVSGEGGVKILTKHLNSIKKLYKVDVTVVNAENASVIGASAAQLRELYSLGADVITMGNHVWGRRELADHIDDMPYVLRPLNLPSLAPGSGSAVVTTGRGIRVGVINLIGRVNMDVLSDDPFGAADRELLALKDKADVFAVEIHAEATSEKGALAYYLDGRVSAVFGTHTHIQTADEQVLPGGTGFITDLGMTGPLVSVLGIKPQQAIAHFLGKIRGRYESAEGPCGISGAIFAIDDRTGKCESVERINIK